MAWADLRFGSMSDAHIRDAVNKLVALKAITPDEATAFLAHRESQRLFVEDAWRRIDDLAAANPGAAGGGYDALNALIEALGWTKGIDFP